MGSRLALGVVLVLVLATQVGAQASMVPEWLGREAAVLRGEREAMLAETPVLFAAAAPSTSASPTDALLVCHVMGSEEGHGGRWDTFADPDLRVVLRAGRFHGTAWGTENSREAWVSFAGVTLTAGTRIEVTLWDRDITGDERMATLRARFEGALPIELADATGTNSCACTVADPERVTRETDAALARAEPAVVRVESARPDLTDPALGRPTTDIDEASTAIATAMGWGGLTEPRACALRERLAASRAGFERAVAAAVTEARRTPTEDAVTAPGTSTRVRYAGVLVAPAAIRAAYPSAPDPIASIVELVLDPPAIDPVLVLGTPDVVDRRGLSHTSMQVVHSASDPARVGLPFTQRVRPRDVVLRIGRGPRVVIVPPE